MCCVLSCFSRVQFFVTLWTVDHQAPLWDFLGKYTGVVCHSLLQGIFPTQEWNLSPASLALYTDCLSLSHQKKVTMKKVSYQIKTNECLMKE